ncbi:acyl-CoA thioesterase [Qipengyuania qiaonensis]|uniref:Acyl-CoA thioesterase n=1 Tax=Qipengyuania qiaonensis TaxID=2867240 RepID=A0ABS7J7J2_9SPHN|nr:acyl-CoA thioesterase [Qipengyuania qiaonensis]MBX7481844.1 acyl-CoA thioesterase [Qipengyuania qiaonensis]
MTTRFPRSFTARPEHIDELGHVNNAVWVQWIQDIATAHWDAVARPKDHEAFFWVVTRHEIDYRGNIDAGESVAGETWIEGAARGATSLRRVDFRNELGRIIVSAATTWAMLDRASGRPARVRRELLAPFVD